MSAEPFLRRLVTLLHRVDVDDTFTATVEDTVLTKLEWARRGASDRQMDDVRALLSSTNVDEASIEKWADELKLTEYWRSARQREP